MHQLLLLGPIGLAAQLVDGTLGTGHGVTSSTLLLSAGVVAATASASVHLAEVGTTLASAVAHWRFGNVDWPTTVRVAMPGAGRRLRGRDRPERTAYHCGLALDVRAAAGTRGVPAGALRPPAPGRHTASAAHRLLVPLGLVAGLVDSTGGGGWGAVTTPTLLAYSRLPVRKVIGSVDAAECAVAVSASAGFLLGMGTTGFLGPVVIALLAGGVVAAPVAAWLVRMVPGQLLGAGVGGLILLAVLRTLLQASEMDVDLHGYAYLAALVGCVLGIGLAVRARRHTRRPPAILPKRDAGTGVRYPATSGAARR